MLRVISGSARNLKLVTPEGLDTRPTTDRIKETLFNMLMPYTAGSVVIDFFAGSGAIGIESLSRGAKRCYFVDNSREAIRCINENLTHTHFTDVSTVYAQDATSAMRLINEKKVDLIFMDPPYDKELEKQLLEQLVNADFVTEDTLIIVEAKLDTKFDYLEKLGYFITKEKKYKTNKHVFLKKNGEKV